MVSSLFRSSTPIVSPSSRSSVLQPDRQSFTPIVSPLIPIVSHSSRSSVTHPDRQSFTLIVSPSSRSSIIHLDRQCFIPILKPSPRSSDHHPDRTSHNVQFTQSNYHAIQFSVISFYYTCNKTNRNGRKKTKVRKRMFFVLTITVQLQSKRYNALRRNWKAENKIPETIGQMRQSIYVQEYLYFVPEVWPNAV